MSSPAKSGAPLHDLSQADGRRREVKVYRRLRRRLIVDSGGTHEVSAARIVVIELLAQAAALTREEFAACTQDRSRDVARFVSLANVQIGAARQLGVARHTADPNPGFGGWGGLFAEAMVSGDPA